MLKGIPSSHMDHEHTIIRIFRDNRSFRDQFHELGPGDCIVSLLNLKPTEEDLFLDLSERGVLLYPSALAQKTARSKCMQAYIYEKWMPPKTTVIRDRHDMIKAIPEFAHVEAVVTKQDRMNCGLGIHKWRGVEEVYNETTFGGLKYPFVLQPFLPDCMDIRVIVLGDYVEAYWRKNKNTFRNNIYFGGSSGPYDLSEDELQFCKTIMKRGRFPYAHIDLMISNDGKLYLSEINLRGGLKGARISTSEYKERIHGLEEDFIRSLKARGAMKECL